MEKTFKLGVSKEIPTEAVVELLFEAGFEFDFGEDVMQQQEVYKEIDEIMENDYGYIPDEDNGVYVQK